ncbi:MAG: hypothetical protein HUJ27_10050 [Rhodobacteraceae bacterium]|nr:hypothetical protein [Paracoccaceae bacterium]
MRRFALALLLLLASSVGYCSLPRTSVAVLTITVTDQSGRKIEAGAAAAYFDAVGQPIVTIASDTPSSWSNNLHWWAHSDHRSSTLRPADARRAVEVEVTAQGCDTVRLPVTVMRSYEALSFAPHGGGPAYFIYSFDQQVTLQCE